MNKDMNRGLIALAVVLVLYCMVVFVIPFEKEAVFWVSFLFTLVSFAVSAYAFYVAFVKQPDAKSRFYGFPIARIGATYAAFQLIAGMLFMVLGAWIHVWIAVLVYATALGAAVLGLLTADAVADEIRTLDVKLKSEVSVMRFLQTRLSQMDSQCSHPEAAVCIRKLSEEFRYSDPVSGAVVADLEGELAAIVDALQQACMDGRWEDVRVLCNKASALLAERNRLCKLNK